MQVSPSPIETPIELLNPVYNSDKMAALLLHRQQLNNVSLSLSALSPFYYLLFLDSSQPNDTDVSVPNQLPALFFFFSSGIRI